MPDFGLDKKIGGERVTYPAHVIQARWGDSQRGTKGLELTFEFNDGDVLHRGRNTINDTLWITDANKDFAYEKLCNLGCDVKKLDFSQERNFLSDPQSILLNAEASLVCEMEAPSKYNNQQPTWRVRFVNKPGTVRPDYNPLEILKRAQPRQTSFGDDVPF